MMDIIYMNEAIPTCDYSWKVTIVHNDEILCTMESYFCLIPVGQPVRDGIVQSPSDLCL